MRYRHGRERHVQHAERMATWALRMCLLGRQSALSIPAADNTHTHHMVLDGVRVTLDGEHCAAAKCGRRACLHDEARFYLWLGLSGPTS